MQYELRLQGQLIQIDADHRNIGTTYKAIALVGDARAMLQALLVRLEGGASTATSATLSQWGRATGRERARAVREAIAKGLDAQGRQLERALLATIRAALPRDAISAWDMTILGYWAAAQFPTFSPRRFLYPLGSGTLGYAWPAALGAKAALAETPALAVVGDGGFMYGASELLTARQHHLDAKLLLIDDGGYGILREYQREAFGETHAVDLVQPDFLALSAGCGVPARLTTEDRIGADLAWAFEQDGPAVVLFKGLLTAAKPTS